MTKRTGSILTALLAILLLAALQGCSGTGTGDHRDWHGGAGDFQSDYKIDFDKLNAQWPGDKAVTSPEEAFSVRVDLGAAEITAPTHLFDAEIQVIPYSNEDNVVDAAGVSFPRGDQVIAEAFPPGVIGYAIKHHRPEYRDLKLTDMGSGMKEHFKLQDTHIELVVGVEREGAPGAITLNNPQSYENGLFGSPDYPMIFVKPAFPDYVGADEAQAFNDNIRTMMLGFNAVSNFPGDYNGGDPLAARDPKHVWAHAINMVKAIAGDEDARTWFKDDENLIYCAELAHVATSAGILVPLNEETLVPEVGQELWDAFVAEVDKQTAGEPSAFTEMNENPRAALVMPALAPEWLQPMPTYAPSDVQDEAEEKLAFQPMTAADIVEQFMRTHIPREILGEGMAPVQGQVLMAMKPGLFESMSLDQLPEDDPARMAAEDVFNRLVEVVSTQYADYAAFQEALRPVMDEARALTGPRDDSGNGLFVPPSLLHVIAQGKHAGGLMGLDYVGHGLHISMVYEEGAEDEETTDDETTDDETTDETTDDETTDDETTDEPWEGFEVSGSVEQGAEYHYATPELAAGQYMFGLAHDEANPGGDADLYVRVGKEPTMDEYDCRPWDTGSDETCDIDLAEGDVIYLMVYGYDEGTNYFVLSGLLVD